MTLLLLAAPVPAAAGAVAASIPVTVPALANWTPEQGSYRYGGAARMVAHSVPEAGSRTRSPTICATGATASSPW
ncbi:hypothetical protein GCM10023084_24870 [Streptomyces lacrimifluminis]